MAIQVVGGAQESEYEKIAGVFGFTVDNRVNFPADSNIDLHNFFDFLSLENNITFNVETGSQTFVGSFVLSADQSRLVSSLCNAIKTVFEYQKDASVTIVPYIAFRVVKTV